MAGLLAAHAGEFAEVALTNVAREYPHYESHWRVDETPVPAIRELHPCFYGSFDWHSCVEMFWVLAHLLRRYPSLVPADEIRAVLNAHLTEPALAAEAAYFAPEHHRTTQRPYGWSILLALTFETATWDDPDAARWSAALQPLSRLFVTRFLDWLPKVGYPIRYGLHENGAFGLSRTLPYADYLGSRGEPQLREVLTETAWRWQRIAAALPEGDDRVAASEAASREHADASLTQVTEGPYAVEHFLAYYALLLLSDAE